ncbi:hypothetical protein DD630_21240 [Streptomyces sp. BSE7F]|nr:hypothetical protein DD630_21240 [Streptomyces sp. BSE7F]
MTPGVPLADDRQAARLTREPRPDAGLLPLTREPRPDGHLLPLRDPAADGEPTATDEGRTA